MITAAKQGRNLVLTMEGVDDPFIIRPLPGRAGLQITDTYLNVVAGSVPAEEWANALIIAVDGARQSPETGRWEPVPEEQQTNFTRIGLELSQEESEGIIMPAFFWQTILGMDGVRAYIEGGEGLPGTLKAGGALTARLGLLARRTSPASA
ncbi:hypothetical protein J2Y69_002137 [Microbacterium resistens]|uniref:Uncharacterized protein n=1 Tax=Microbacterium resistens TaxID=156977 RepID=A0ABU1SF23_9MICO|nr:hypothetical protein [Microbacterium resistens]MDR6867533.1 hypothetical protein [Microbacterium resistens]